MTPLTATVGTCTTSPTWAGMGQRQPTPRSRREPRRLLTEPKLVPLELSKTVIIIEVKGPEPAWFYPTLSWLQRLNHLGENWDSYGGRPPQDDVIVNALELIGHLLGHDSTPPAIVPTSAGGVQLEWHRAGDELEIRVAPNGEISAFRVNEAAGEVDELDRVTLSDLGPLVALTGQL